MKIQKSFFAALICTSALFIGAPAYGAGITISVIPTLAPDIFNSPSYFGVPGWENNSVTALMGGTFEGMNSPTSATPPLTQFGDPTMPTNYQAQSTVVAEQAIVTDANFPAWMGQANPTGNFANETGDRMTFGLIINGNGTKFSISQLGYYSCSNDTANLQGACSAANPTGLLGDANGPGTYDYGSGYVGVVFGTGGAPNTYYDVSGVNSNQLVDAIYARGSGNSPQVDCTVDVMTGFCDTASDGGLTLQQLLDNEADYTNDIGLTSFAGDYYLVNGDGTPIANGSASFSITETPEPSTLLLLFSAVPAVAAFRRRRQRS